MAHVNILSITSKALLPELSFAALWRGHTCEEGESVLLSVIASDAASEIGAVRVVDRRLETVQQLAPAVQVVTGQNVLQSLK